MKALFIVSKDVKTFVDVPDDKLKEAIRIRVESPELNESFTTVIVNRGFVTQPNDPSSMILIYAPQLFDDTDIIEALSDSFDVERVNHFTEGSSLN